MEEVYLDGSVLATLHTHMSCTRVFCSHGAHLILTQDLHMNHVTLGYLKTYKLPHKKSMRYLSEKCVSRYHSCPKGASCITPWVEGFGRGSGYYNSKSFVLETMKSCMLMFIQRNKRCANLYHEIPIWTPKSPNLRSKEKTDGKMGRWTDSISHLFIWMKIAMQMYLFEGRRKNSVVWKKNIIWITLPYPTPFPVRGP